MARHPRIEACMFCMQFPCVCQPAVKKAAPKRKRAEPSTPVTSVEIEPSSSSSQDASSAPSATSSDTIKAAMQAAMTPEQKMPENPNRLITREQANEQHQQSYNPELLEAINNLEPILHISEKRAYADVLNRPEMRAKRWRDRNGK